MAKTSSIDASVFLIYEPLRSSNRNHQTRGRRLDIVYLPMKFMQKLGSEKDHVKAIIRNMQCIRGIVVQRHQKNHLFDQSHPCTHHYPL